MYIMYIYIYKWVSFSSEIQRVKSFVPSARLSVRPPVREFESGVSCAWPSQRPGHARPGLGAVWPWQYDMSEVLECSFLAKRKKQQSWNDVFKSTQLIDFR